MAQQDYQDPYGYEYPAYEPPEPSYTPIPLAPGQQPGPDVSWGPFLPSTPTPTPTPTPTTGGGGGGYGGPMRPSYQIPNAPNFNFSYAAFQAPTAESAMNEPGYQFRLDQGRKALEQSASGRGVLRTGGTLKDILGYGQNFASQEYGRVYDRAAGEYDRGYRNAYDVARDSFAPQLADWQTRSAAAIRAGDQEFNRYLDLYKYDNPSADSILDYGSR